MTAAQMKRRKREICERFMNPPNVPKAGQHSNRKSANTAASHIRIPSTRRELVNRQWSSRRLVLAKPILIPRRLIGDKGYDRDALDRTPAELGIEMIAPKRSNQRPENITQDGRPLRRNKTRWIVERSCLAGQPSPTAHMAGRTPCAFRCLRHSRLPYDCTPSSSTLVLIQTFRTALGRGRRGKLMNAGLAKKIASGRSLFARGRCCRRTRSIRAVAQMHGLSRL